MFGVEKPRRTSFRSERAAHADETALPTDDQSRLSFDARLPLTSSQQVHQRHGQKRRGGHAQEDRPIGIAFAVHARGRVLACLLYTSDAADDNRLV